MRYVTCMVSLREPKTIYSWCKYKYKQTHQPLMPYVGLTKQIKVDQIE